MKTLSETTKHQYYNALIKKDSEYEWIFFVGVKTTGIFCRPTCSARKPKFENCEFFSTAKEALLASFRPCQRCKPLSHPNNVSNLVAHLVEAVEKNPEKRWKTKDFKLLSIDESTARRQFKRRFGMTFVEYARSRRLGIAMKQIRRGETVMNAGIDSGYESNSGFRDAFSKIFAISPKDAATFHNILHTSWIDTKLGPMLAIADEKALYLLEFVDRRGLEQEIAMLKAKTKAAIIPGKTTPIISIEKELTDYFEGTLKQFKTPISLLGSPFQKLAWEELMKIPYGQTRSYLEEATAIGRPTSYRAVANANGANKLAIIIPCHRIINNNGAIGGYGGGVHRKKWLLEHEKKRILINKSQL